MIAGVCAIHLVSMPDFLMSAGYRKKVPTEQTRTSNGHAMSGSYKANPTLSTTSIFSSRSRTFENGHNRSVAAGSTGDRFNGTTTGVLRQEVLEGRAKKRLGPGSTEPANCNVDQAPAAAALFTIRRV